jgi:N-acetylneuraminate synthase
MDIFIIAEIGINHNGDVEVAKELIKGAKYAGANAVKFQKRTIDLVYSEKELNLYRESPWGTTNREQKHGLEFSEEQYDIIDDFCKRLD